MYFWVTPVFFAEQNEVILVIHLVTNFILKICDLIAKKKLIFLGEKKKTYLKYKKGAKKLSLNHRQLCFHLKNSFLTIVSAN